MKPAIDLASRSGRHPCGMNIAPHKDPVRASLARTLADYYHELSGFDGKPPPRFSLARAVREAGTQLGLSDGYEHEVCSAAVLLSGTRDFVDGHRLNIPLSALRTLTTQPGSQGGYLVGTQTASPIDVLRPYSVIAEAGINMIEGLVNNVAIPRVANAAPGGWIGEGGSLPEAQPTLGQASLTPRTGGAIVYFSHQLLKQGEAGEALLRQQLLATVGTLLDKAFFVGVGGIEPIGLLSTPGVQSVSGTGLAHAGLLDMREAVLAAGGREDRLRWVAAPAVQKLLGARERSSGGGRYLWDDGFVLGRPAHATATAPASTLVVGDFTQAYLGIWGPAPSIRVEVNPYQDFNAAGMAARVLLIGDFVFPQPTAFAVAKAIT